MAKKSIRRKTQITKGLFAFIASFAIASSAWAQSADALIDKLVEKGILSVKEAKYLREESDKNFGQAYQVKSGMPDWLQALKWNGDFRGRYEAFYGDNEKFVDRNRLRYRLRLGATAVMFDNLEVGARLTSSEPSGGFGGDPISGNTTFADNASKKFVYFDQVYAKWTPVNSPDWFASFTFGKMENPFVSPSTMMFDRDYTPEGFAAQLAYNFNDKHSAKFNGGAFVLDEFGDTSSDPYLLMGQLRLNSAWTPKISSSLGLAWLGISDTERLGNTTIPNVNRGNTRETFVGGTMTNQVPSYNFNPIYADVTFTYTLDKAPGYAGPFPISLMGDYVYNPGAPDANRGYTVGLMLGKSGKRKTWAMEYRWQELQGDAWFEEFPESDFGAFYQAQLPNAGFSGSGAGYGAGTNIRGHMFRASYSPYDSLTFDVTYWLTELIRENPVNSESGMGRIQVDAVWKF